MKPPVETPTRLFLILLVLPLLVIPGAHSYALEASCDQTVYEVLADGSVVVNVTLSVNNAPTDVVVIPEAPPLIASAFDEDGFALPVSYNNTAIIVTLYENATITVTYITLDLTTKEGPVWTLSIKPACQAIVLLPEDSVPVMTNPQPEPTIYNGMLALSFPPGDIMVQYMLSPAPVSEDTTGTATTATQQGETTTTTGGGTGNTPGAGETSTIESSSNSNYVVGVVGVLAVLAGAAAYYVIRGRRTHGSALLAEARLDERDKAIIEALSTYGPMSASDLMRLTGIPKTPLYRRLKRLVEEGVLEAFEEEGVRKYRLGGSRGD